MSRRFNILSTFPKPRLRHHPQNQGQPQTEAAGFSDILVSGCSRTGCLIWTDSAQKTYKSEKLSRQCPYRADSLYANRPNTDMEKPAASVCGCPVRPQNSTASATSICPTLTAPPSIPEKSPTAPAPTAPAASISP